MKRLTLSLSLVASLTLAACSKTFTSFRETPTYDDLDRGGIYVAYNLGCEKGCERIGKGDLILMIDGRAVETSKDLDAVDLTDGKPHQLHLLAFRSHEPKTVEIVATPGTKMPPLERTPPFWTVSADDLNQAPEWARRPLFGHASPRVLLVGVDGGILDGRQLYGKKRLIVYWDQSDRGEKAASVQIMQVLQKAQSDLHARAVEVMFVRVPFPTGRQVPMSDVDLRNFQDSYMLREGDRPLPPVPMYRIPNESERDVACELGMEHGFTVIKTLSRSPAIVLLDERGIVRWHSEGIVEGPDDAAISDPRQYAIIEAVRFALERL